MEEWKIYRLGDLVDFQNGYAFKSSKFLYDGKYKIIRIKELKNGLVKFFEDTVSISDEPNEILSKILVNKGDVIFALTGDPVSKQNANSWVGRVSLYTHDIPAYLNQRTCKIIQCNNVVPQYVYYYFRQYENLYSLASKATGSASQANISTKILEDTEILLPSLSVQKKMVAILASLDNKIALNRRINDNLEQQTQALFKSWFVDFEPFRGGKFVDSELGMIPEGWNIQPISSIFNFQEGPGIRNWQYVNNGTKFINIRCINNDIINIQNANMISDEEAQGKYAHFMLKENDIVISCSGTLGRKALVLKEYLPLCLNTSVIRFTPRINRQLGFLYGYLGSSLFLNKQIELASGSVQANFGPIHLKGMSIAIPDNNVLNQFSDIVNSIIQKKKNIISESLRLTNLRDSILPKLMSGKIKIDKLNS